MRRKAGFTLIELMIVVGTIGVLAAIAIPDFLKFQGKAKQSEAKVMMQGIVSREMQHKLQAGEFVVCPWNPPAAGKGWDPAQAEWKKIGFAPVGPLLYQYSVEMDGTGFVVKARGNIDNDGDLDEWSVKSANLAPENEKSDL